MIYSPSVTIPANTLPSNPLVLRVPVTLGLLYHFEVYFPPGSAGLVHVQLWNASHQVYPSNEGEDFYGDNVTLEFDDLYPKETDIAQLQIKAWNLDDTYSHAVVVRLAMLPRDAFAARFAPNVSSDQLSEIIALLAAQQGRRNPAAVDALTQTFTPTGA